MAVRLGDAVLYLSADDEKLRRGLRDAERETRSWGGLMEGVLQGFGMGLFNAATGALSGALTTVAGFIQDGIGLSSDLAETQNRVQVIFGDSATAIETWAQTAVTQLGQTSQQALDAAAQFAIFGGAAGLTGQDLVAFGTELTTLATDLASFNNTSVDQAIDALGAALRGESEPIRSYGVLLDEATLKATALKLGLESAGEASLTTSDRVLAAKQAILDQTTLQQGDFARTSDGYANSVKILGAAWDEFKTSAGDVLVAFITPIVSALAGATSTELPDFGAALESAKVKAKEWGEAGAKAVTDFIDGFTGKAPAATTKANEFGAATKEFGDYILANMPNMTEGVGSFFAAFSSPEAAALYGFFEGLLDVITIVITATGELLELVAFVGKLFGALFTRDFGRMAQLADEYAKAFPGGVAAMGDRFRDLFNMVPWSPAQPQTQSPTTVPTTGGPQPPNYGLHDGTVGATQISMVINAASADPLAVGAAARDGLLSALYAAGVS